MVTQPRPAKVLGTLTAVCAFGLAVSCTEEPPVAPAPEFSGTWSLVAVDNVPVPHAIAVLIDGSVRSVTGGQLIVRSRRRLDDTKHIVLQNGTAVLEDVVDTLTSPFSATATTLLVHRYGLLASDDWVDTGTVRGSILHLRARYLEPVHRTVQHVTLTYVKDP